VSVQLYCASRPPVHNVIFSGRLPHDTPTNVIDGVVKKTLRSLGLTDVRKNRIGTYFERGISGGQKRRVTIASSVITQPRILLCDEPMSGLDSTTGYQVANASERLRSYFRTSESCWLISDPRTVKLND
jgi:ABC-type multidrug transport system ATPase subunit